MPKEKRKKKIPKVKAKNKIAKKSLKVKSKKKIPKAKVKKKMPKEKRKNKISKAKNKIAKKSLKVKSKKKIPKAKVKKPSKLGEFKSLLSEVHEDKRFFCVDGGVFNSLKELDKALKSMSKETFSYHVNSEKNDFSSWIYDVIGDKNLADNLRKSTSQKNIAKKIKTRIEYLKRKIKS